MVLQIVAGMRTLKLHGRENQATTAAIQKLAESAQAIMPALRDRVELQFVDDVLLLNGYGLPAHSGVALQFRVLHELLASRQIGGVAFRRNADVASIAQWLALIVEPVDTEAAIGSLRDRLERLNVAGIETLERKALTGDMSIEVLKVNSASYALQTYARTIVGFREFVQALKQGGDPFIGRLNLIRVVQDLVDICKSNGSLLLGILELRSEHDDLFDGTGANYTTAHAANTCIYSLLIGGAVGIDRLSLVDVGTSALLAKVGFAMLPNDLVDKRGEFTPAERVQLKRAMVQAVQILIRHSRLSDAMLRRVIAAYEQHRPYVDPRLGTRTDTHVYSRIIVVADAYDAMLAKRPWRDALPRDVVLENLRRDAARKFDPVIVGALFSILRARMNELRAQA